LRRLIVNADDLGFTQGVNLGILEAHRRGILTSTTLMANGAAFEHAVRLAADHPTLDVGCHLTLIGGASLLPPFSRLPSTVPELLKTLVAGRLCIYEELAAQVRKILEAGIVPTHLDSHKHTHALPQVLEAVARVSEEFRIPWVRRPLDVPLLKAWHRRVLERHHCRTTDHFEGRGMTGRFGTEELVGMIRRLPVGTTEFMCHPGYCTPDLQAAHTRLKQSREREMKALSAPETRQVLHEAQVQLVNFRELLGTPA
jgi:predicted glycoside hydrolase/deacetylase ChbG (UPF0249 family)